MRPAAQMDSGMHRRGQASTHPRQLTGEPLTVVYSAECRAAQRTNRATNAMLPILVVLFVFSYAILTMLVFEQGQTIESQRGLIREMMKDSSQLAAMKGKIARDESQRTAQKPAANAGQQAQGQQKEAAPKISGKDARRPGKSARSLKQAPGKPASDLEDVRRSTRVI